MPFTAGLKPTSTKSNQNIKENSANEIKGAIGAAALVAVLIMTAGYAADEYLKSKTTSTNSNAQPTPAQVTSTPIPSPTPTRITTIRQGK